jgi:hypothetical protein
MTEDVMTDDETIQIDNIIAEISSTQQVVVKEEPTTAVKRTFTEEEKYTDDTLINMTLKKNDEVEDMANRAFDLFYQGLSRNTDHTSSSKEQMLEALKVRVELNKTMVELAKLKKKQESSIGVLINAVSPSQAGIDMRKIQEEYSE